MAEEHEIEVNGTDTLWGETGNYAPTVCSRGAACVMSQPRRRGLIVLGMTWR